MSVVLDRWPQTIPALGDAILAAEASRGPCDAVATFDHQLGKKLRRQGSVLYWSGPIGARYEALETGLLPAALTNKDQRPDSTPLLGVQSPPSAGLDCQAPPHAQANLSLKHATPKRALPSQTPKNGKAIGLQPIGSGSRPIPTGPRPIPTGSRPIPTGSRPIPTGSRPIPNRLFTFSKRSTAYRVRSQTYCYRRFTCSKRLFAFSKRLRAYSGRVTCRRGSKRPRFFRTTPTSAA